MAAAGDDVQVCAGQVGQEAVAEHLDRLDLVAFAGDDEDGASMLRASRVMSCPVFPEEPIPTGSRLLSTPGIVLTPHLAGASRQTAANAARVLAEDVGRYLRGEPLAHAAKV